MSKRTALICNLIYFLANALIALGFLIKKSPFLVANPIVTSAGYLALILLEKYTSFRLKNYLRVLLIITLTSHSLIGEYFRYYYTSAYFDKALHLFGTFSFTLVSFEILNSFIIILSSRPKIYNVLFATLLGTSLGTAFELAEFALDYFMKERNQFGLVDTDLDILFDVVGALLAGIFIIKPRVY